MNCGKWHRPNRVVSFGEAQRQRWHTRRHCKPARPPYEGSTTSALACRRMRNFDQPTRALRQIAAAGAGTLLVPQVLRGQGCRRSSWVESRSRSPATSVAHPPSALRLPKYPVRPDRPCRIRERWWPRRPGQHRCAPALRPSSTVNAGDLVVRFTPDPADAGDRDARREGDPALRAEPETPVVSFSLGDGPLASDSGGRAAIRSQGHRAIRHRNGQGGYQLRTHGGRVPIQWLVSTDGWGLFIHQPLGVIRSRSAASGTLTPY